MLSKQTCETMDNANVCLCIESKWKIHNEICREIHFKRYLNYLERSNISVRQLYNTQIWRSLKFVNVVKFSTTYQTITFKQNLIFELYVYSFLYVVAHKRKI